jgi:hypothetical protein
VSAQAPWDALLRELQELTESGSRRIAEHRAELEGRTGCVECGQPLGTSGRWYADGFGGLIPYCATCAEIERPVL